MRWPRRKSKNDMAMGDPQVAAVLEEITNRLNSTSLRLRDFSADLQVNINTLKRYAATAEKKIQENK